MRSVVLALVLMFSLPAFAEAPVPPDTATTAGATESRQNDNDIDPHPIFASTTVWAGGAVIVILGLFLAAAVIGPMVRTEFPEDVPVAFSHEEDPSHHVGSEHSIWEERH